MAVATKKFIRKPLYVDAVRINNGNFDQIVAWCQGEVMEDEQGTGKKYIKVRVHNPKNPRQTKAFVGDWLLYTERGYKVYTNKAFHASFDPVQPATTEELKKAFGQEEPKPEAAAGASSHVIYRDATNGQIVSAEYAQANPDTTVRETVEDQAQFALVYIDPTTGFLTDVKPHEGAKALSFSEIMQIVLTEIHTERHFERVEAARRGTPVPLTVAEAVRAEQAVQEGREPDLAKAQQAKPGHSVSDAPARDVHLHSVGPVPVDPEPGNGVGEIISATTPQGEPVQLVEATPRSIAQAVQDDEMVRQQAEAEPVQPDAVEGKRVLSIGEQQAMTPDEIRELIQSGEVVLAQDIARP